MPCSVTRPAAATDTAIHDDAKASRSRSAAMRDMVNFGVYPLRRAERSDLWLPRHYKTALYLTALEIILLGASAAPRRWSAVGGAPLLPELASGHALATTLARFAHAPTWDPISCQ